MTEYREITRRGALALGLGGAALLARPAMALDIAAAESFMQGVIDDLRGLIDGKASGDAGAKKFLALLDEKAAVPQVAKFAMGRTWREMSDTQQAAYQQAFRGYIARTYAKRFSEYSGEDIVIDGSVDAGKKGVLVKSTLKRPTAEDIAVEWLVSDRLGPIKLADIVFEGVSLSITLREIFGGMVEERGGDVDRFIADLDKSEGA